MAEHQSSGSKWLWGCTIGCGALLIIAVVAGFLLYRFAMTALDEGTRQLADEFSERYDEWKEADRVPEEQEPIYDELVEIMHHPDASPFAILLVVGTVASALEDGEVGEDEQQMAEAVLSLLRENPGVGVFEIGTIFEEHPELYEAFQELQQGVTEEPIDPDEDEIPMPLPSPDEVDDPENDGDEDDAEEAASAA